MQELGARVAVVESVVELIQEDVSGIDRRVTKQEEATAELRTQVAVTRAQIMIYAGIGSFISVGLLTTMAHIVSTYLKLP